MPDTPASALPIVVLISGRGSNLQSIIDSVTANELPVEIRAVISNQSDAAGLQRAAEAGIATAVICHTTFGNRTDFERALQVCIDSYQPALIVLAGFMRILGPEFVQHYQGRLLNIHPALLPDFPGLDTHRRALEAGCKEHGASVHFVTEETDGGPVVLQVRVPVQEDDTPESLAQRVLVQEHRILPLAIRWFAEGRLAMGPGGQVMFDNERLTRPHIVTAESAPA